MIATHITQLENSGLIRLAQIEPELAYLFRHALVREAAYHSLLKTDRRTLHAHTAHTLEQLYPTPPAELGPVLAYHFEQAGEPAKAAHYYLQAGDDARARFAYVEAIAAYTQALALLQGQKAYARAAHTLMRLGLLYHNQMAFAQSQAAYTQAFALWEQASTTPPPPLPPAPQPLRLLWVVLTELDPSFIPDTGNGAIIDQLFRGLVDLTPDLDIVPALAQRWEMLDAGRRYRFYLRPDWRWSDGVPVTAHDVVLGWHRTLSRPENLGRTLLAELQGVAALPARPSPAELATVGVRALSDQVLEVELAEPLGHFLHLLSNFATFPVPRHQIAALGEAWTHQRPLVSNGPFVLTQHTPDGVYLERNPRYPLALGGNVQQVHLFNLRPNATFAEAQAAYEAGALEVLNLNGPLEVLQPLLERHAPEQRAENILQVHLLHLDPGHPQLADLRVRQALAQSLDMQALLAAVYGFRARPALGGVVPPGLPGHTPGLHWPYAPAQAQALLAAAGFPAGRGFPLLPFAYLAESPSHEQLATYVCAQWQAVLNLSLQPWPISGPNYWPTLREQRPPVSRIGWAADYPDADNFLHTLVLQQTRWRDPAYLQLATRARHLTDPLERQRLHQALDRWLMQAVVLLPVAYDQVNLLVQPWVMHYPLSPLKTFNFGETVLGEPPAIRA